MSGIFIKIIALVVLIAVIYALSSFLYYNFGPSEYKTKQEFSLLQDANERNNLILKKIKFEKIEGYHLMGIYSPWIKENIWILLNPKAPPHYKQIPSGQYTVTKNELEYITKVYTPTSTVLECLKSHVVRESNVSGPSATRHMDNPTPAK